MTVGFALSISLNIPGSYPIIKKKKKTFSRALTEEDTLNGFQWKMKNLS